MPHHVVIFCGPRGAGKGTLVGAVSTSFPQFTKIVCHTTRPMRPGECDGDQYWFISRESFQRHIRCGAFVGWKEISPAQISGLSEAELLRHRYGVTDVTPDIARAVRNRLARVNGRVCIVGVRAPVEMRTERIRLRERGITSERVNQLLAEDPVTDCDVERTADIVIDNDCQGDPSPALRAMRHIVSTFIEDGP